ncbi:MAG: glycoside hydrolase family 127 protein [Acidobacteria bacterium]|nr:glycoside hydrolase family 127 protein [Acidobacteriota bacterium]
MATIGLIIMAVLLVGCGQEAADYPIQPVPFTQVKLTDGFWAPRLETNRTVTIPHAFRMCEREGRLHNFALAAGRVEGEYRGQYPFNDTDVYKTIEGASYALMIRPDPKLDAYLDTIIELIGAAQEPDGYLYTARTTNAERLIDWSGEKRWAKLHHSHELFNAGHLFEAAAAHYQATGKQSLLDIALRFADLIVRTFGPGRLEKPPGHQVIEMGLVKLYRATGEEKYLRLAKYFLDLRGRPGDGRELGGEYNQDHRPVAEQDEAVGHAVRAGYMYAAMADVAALTGDESYREAIDRLWENVAGKKLYLTGGIGATGSIEGFSGNYDLPNMSAYNETCASIANVYWNHRLFLLHGDARYIDVMERTLYNAFLSGVGMDGQCFFYPNPLESVGQHQRREWFGCACCPSNVTRFMASLPGYVYAIRDDHLYVNLYVAGQGELDVGGQNLRLEQATDYPWGGRVRLTVTPEAGEADLALHLRVPGWARGRPLDTDLYRYLDPSPAVVHLAVNGEAVLVRLEKGYAVLERQWHAGDIIELDLPMAVRRVVAYHKVRADQGRVALERGPLVFCAEGHDFADGHVRDLLLPDNAALTVAFRPDLLAGVAVIQGETMACHLDEAGKMARTAVPFTAIPYYAWSHRGAAEMAVWLAREESAVHPQGMPELAAASRVTVRSGRHAGALNDGRVPCETAGGEVPASYTWRPENDTTEWVQYGFREPVEVSMADVWWFTDAPQQCRPPVSWRLLYYDGDDWRPVYRTGGTYGVAPGRFNTVVFETVRTLAVRLEIQPASDSGGGIYEWRIR